jgi:hypothetical protein
LVPDLTSAHEVYESLVAVHSEKMAEGDSKYGKVRLMGWKGWGKKFVQYDNDFRINY